MINTCFPFLLVLLMASCSDKNEKREHTLASIEERAHVEAKIDTLPAYNFPYNILKPSRQCILPSSLIEVSGLTMYNDTQIAAVNDEQGVLFQYDLDSCALIDQYKFGGLGDYEGIELVNSTDLFAITSNGNIFHTKTNDSEFSEMYNTALSQTNDVEGLGYDPERNRLLLACKSSPNIKTFSRLKNTKAVFAFSLESYSMNEDPVLQITDADLIAWFEKKNNKDAFSRKTWKQFRNRILDFSPSAIGVHPLDGNYYLLSSVGKLLVVMDRKARIQHIQFLDKKVFLQPEGICFDASGNMFISNEGKGARAKMFKFDAFYPSSLD